LASITLRSRSNKVKVSGLPADDEHHFYARIIYSVKMANADIDVINIYRRLVDSLLAKAEEVKPGKEIEPPLTETQLGESFWVVQGEDEEISKQLGQQTKFAAVEIAFRERFYSLLVRFSAVNHLSF
jgi:hypothetical protein